MAYRKLPLAALLVNPSNDRHGELENETAAISQLFATQEPHMRNLARDLVNKGDIFEPPLVFLDRGKYIVADGNRRTTCLKLLANPRRAPTVDLQKFFSDLRTQWPGKFPEKIECRVENDRDRVDDILYRRHTGVQGGIGQSTWTDRMKNNFVLRTGKNTGMNVADEIEKRLHEAKLLPTRKIPRSNLNRLLSAEALRNRVGISVRKGKLEFIRDEQTTLGALHRIAHDLAIRTITLEDIWDTQRKLDYIDRLDCEGVLPGVTGRPSRPPPAPPTAPSPSPKPRPPKSPIWPHLIPNVDYGISWPAHLHRHHEIWDELQYHLELNVHPNAISVLLRVLLEISIDNYVTRKKPASVHENDKLSNKVIKVSENLAASGEIDRKYLSALRKLRNSETIISVDTLNRYVHSTTFNVSPEHLKMIWSTISEFVVLCLKS